MLTVNKIELCSKFGYWFSVHAGDDAVSVRFSQPGTGADDIEISFSSAWEMGDVAKAMLRVADSEALEDKQPEVAGLFAVQIVEVHSDPGYYHTVRVGPDVISLRYTQLEDDDVELTFNSVDEMRAVAGAMKKVAAAVAQSY